LDLGKDNDRLFALVVKCVCGSGQGHVTLESIIVYGSQLIAVGSILINRKGMHPFIPIGLFSSWYATAISYVAEHFHWWSYRMQGHPEMGMSYVVDLIVVPSIVMHWIRYGPKDRGKRVIAALLLSILFTAIEYVLVGTNLYRVHSGFRVEYSGVMWFFSLFLWDYVHAWLSKK
jgi:hypothetical protein